jgi:hypothetical protein
MKRVSEEVLEAERTAHIAVARYGEDAGARQDYRKCYHRRNLGARSGLVRGLRVPHGDGLQIRKRKGRTGISVLTSWPTDNVYLPASGCNAPARFECRAFSAGGGKISKPKTVAFPTVASDTLPFAACRVPPICSVPRLTYPAADGSAAILPSMLPKNPRVRVRGNDGWCSANQKFSV